MEEIRCPGCMQLKTKRPLCEHCGYNENIDNLPHQLPVGTVLQGRYEIGKTLGQGGFGITYIGWDHKHQVPVAVKEFYMSGIAGRQTGFNHSVTVNSPDSEEAYNRNKARFLKEANTLARLNDIPEIVHIYKLFEENNTVYIVMEYLKGIDLRRYIRMVGGRLSLEKTFAIMRPIMTALEQVHAEELVHRDISPDNIMLMSDGQVKLLDFGAAREVLYADPNKDLSQSTEAILKHGFAPMEQYQRSGTLGPWTDVYALSATIYYCLTGKIPPDAPNRFMEGAQINWQQIPGLNPRQVKALTKAMALVPKDRMHTVEELELALFGNVAKKAVKRSDSASMRSTTGVEDRKKASSSGQNNNRKPVWPKVAAAAALLAAVGAGALLLGSGGEKETAKGFFEGAADRTISYKEGSRAEIWLDENGRESGRILWDPENAVIYKFTAEYNENGDMLNQKTLNAKDQLLRTDSCTYDGNGNLIREEEKMADGTVLTVTEYSYNSNGDKSSSETRRGDGSFLSARSWTYDESGTLLSSHREDADHSTMDWTYDSYGNVKTLEYRDENEVLERTISYVHTPLRQETLMRQGDIMPGNQMELVDWGGLGDSGGGGGSAPEKPASPIAKPLEDDYEEPADTEPTETEAPATVPGMLADDTVEELGEDVIWVNTRRQQFGPDNNLEYTYDMVYDREGVIQEETCTNGKGALENRREYIYSEEEWIGSRWEYVSSGEFCSWYMRDIFGDTVRIYEENEWTTGYSTYNAAGRLEKRESYNLNGTLSSVTEYRYNEWAEEQGRVYRYYDSYGGYTETEYDAEDRILSDNTYDKDGARTGWTTHTYEGTLETRSISYGADGSVKNEYEFDYDAYGQLERRKVTYRYDDGSYSVSVYDGEYNELTYDRYSAAGAQESHREYSYTYDDQGNVIVKTAHDETGRLAEENLYSYDQDGVLKETKYIYYYSDGSSSESVYDQDYNRISSTSRDSGGQVTSHNTYSYEFNEHGKVAVEYCYDETGALKSRTVYTYDESGNTLQYHEYDGNGKLNYWVEYIYDENGNFVDSELHWEP